MIISRARLAHLTRAGGLMRNVAEQSLANIAVQALGAITTLSFVHLLPTRDYALFGLCLTTVNFIVVTSDLGLMASINYFWRREIAGGTPFAERYAAIRAVRRILFALSGIVAVAVLAWLELREGEGAVAIAVASILVLILSWTQINAQMIVIPLRLMRQLRRANMIELVGAVIRAGLAGLAFLLALRQAWFPLASLGIASIITWALAARYSPPQVRERRPLTRESMRRVISYIVPTMPATIVFATQSLLVYWLASLHGGAVVVAETFALGRLAAIFVTLNSVMANVIIPRVVNLADDRHAYRNGVMAILVMLSACGLLTIFSAIFPRPVLFVLGKEYSGLGFELVLSLAAASFSIMGQMFGQLNRTMGWIRWESPMIALHAVIMIALAPFFDFGTTDGVLMYSLILTIAGALEMVAVTLLGRSGIMKAAKETLE